MKGALAKCYSSVLMVRYVSDREFYKMLGAGGLSFSGRVAAKLATAQKKARRKDRKQHPEQDLSVEAGEHPQDPSSAKS